MSNHACVYISIFRFFETDIGDYCIVGDHEGFPEEIRGDIDVVVAQEEVPSFTAKIQRFCRLHNIQLVQILQHEWSAFYHVLGWLDGASKPRFLHVDICGDYVRRGRPFVRAAELLDNRVRARNRAGGNLEFNVCSPPVEFLYYCLKKIDKGDLNSRHGHHLSQAWSNDPAGAAQQVRRFWSGDEAEMLSTAAQDGNWEPVREALPKLRRSLHRRLPRTPMGNRVREITRKARRTLNPTGLHVAFLGADGSGKSTVSATCAAALAPAFRRTDSRHLRPGVWGGRHNRGPVTDPHAEEPRSFATSIIKLGYLYLDYALGWWIKVWPSLVRSTLVVFDRYYHDLLVDPRRYRYGGPMWLARLVGRLIPKPDLWILLDAPAETLQLRKQEVPLEETQRQCKAYRSLFDGLKNAVIVDGSQPLERVAADVNLAILDHLAQRTKRRFGLGSD